MKDPTDVIEVLFVDDNEGDQRLVAESLEELRDGLYVVTESTVDEGLAWLHDPEPDIDCVVSDYSMLNRDGLDFLAAVRETDPDLPFILYTGRGSEEVASEAISAGVTDYLTKGDDVETFELLANRIENAVATYRATKEIQRVYDALEVAQTGIALLDDEGRFTYVNRAFAALYGYEPDELLGEHWSLTYPEQEVQRVNDEILYAVEDGEAWQGVTTGVRKDGSTFREDQTLVKREDGGLICSVRESPVGERDLGD